MIVEINGQEYDFKFTLKAIREWLTLTLEDEKSVSDLDWVVLGFKHSGTGLTKKVIEDWMEENFEDSLKLINHCRKQIQAYQKALNGSYENGEANETDKKKLVQAKP